MDASADCLSRRRYGNGGNSENLSPALTGGRPVTLGKDQQGRQNRQHLADHLCEDRTGE